MVRSQIAKKDWLQLLGTPSIHMKIKIGTDVKYLQLSQGEKKKPLGAAKWNWFVIAVPLWIITIFLGGYIYWLNITEFASMVPKGFHYLHELPDTLSGYLINTPGCRIPDMDPFDPSIKQYLTPPKKLKCDKKRGPFFDSNLTSLIRLDYNKFLYADLRCCYKILTRKDPGAEAHDNLVKYSKICKEIKEDVVSIEDEFVKVRCKKGKTGNYFQDYFAFVPVKRVAKPSKTLKPNVLLIGLDALSRINLRRQMPKTYNYLKKELNAIDLSGYNKVADNTFPNVLPVLAGMTEDEVSKTCNPEFKAHFDDCPFLWKKFSQNGYVTAIAEDCSCIGVFDNGKKGFMKQPTDYYYNNFEKEVAKRIGYNKDLNCHQCMGNRVAFKEITGYLKKIVTRMYMESLPYFAFFWSSTLSHDYLNRPRLGDDTYHSLFKNFKENGYLENTILILMSDHGMRFGDIRTTYQGQMEERLPFVMMVFPKWFNKKYPKAMMNLNKNTKRLTTPFDLHETLKDLLDVNKLSSVRRISNASGARGFSLFNEIPKTRTCEDAAIDSHWCTCQKSIVIDSNDIIVKSAANFAVHKINKMLDGYADCANLSLGSITNARVLTHNNEINTKKKAIKDYTITLMTKPGRAIFEATVRLKEAESSHQIPRVAGSKNSHEEQWRNFNTAGTISRLNLYGKQSYCITDFHLKLYCYCKSLLKP